MSTKKSDIKETFVVNGQLTSYDYELIWMQLIYDLYNKIILKQF